MLTKLFFRCVRLVAMTSAMASLTTAGAQIKPQYQYFRTGSAKDVAVATQAGFALMGGGKDLDEAFRWMCERAGSGDFLVLRATGDDDYNPYIQPLCKLNSVATLILPNREAAMDPFVAETIAHAEAIFIAGGDQANYIRFWMGTPVQAEINKAIQRGVPVGGTSAGLAVLGEWAYSAEGDKPGNLDLPNLDAKTALMDSMGPRVTLVHGFLNIPILKGIITDSHFAKRDRMGRLLVFLFRLNEPDGKEVPPPSFKTRGIGVEQGAAVLIEPDGAAAVVGGGSGYFVEQTHAAFVEKAGDPITGLAVTVWKVLPNRKFNLKSWTGDAIQYELSIQDRKVVSSQPGGSLY